MYIVAHSCGKFAFFNEINLLCKMYYDRLFTFIHILALYCCLNIIDGTENSGSQRKKSLEAVYKDPKKLKNQLETWNGRWFPEKSYKKNDLYKPHEKSMFNVITKCDDGKTNLEIDWDSSPINYTCFVNDVYNPDVSLRPVIRNEHIPPAYHAYHACMDHKIEYDNIITTFGTHRPVWARYGEYRFLPRQRWLHNAEHGAVIMLYHPCAHPALVSELRFIVTSCLYRHIITPYNLLPENRPLALITWGHYLSMSIVNPKLVLQFIKQHALHGPENINDDGLYDYLLQEPAKPVVNYNDTNLCANLNEYGRVSNVVYNLLQ